MLLAAWVTNILLGQFCPGFTGQPIAHTDVLWNFLGMVLAGAAVAHNFNTVSSPDGVSPFGPPAVLVGLSFCLGIGMTQRDRP